jgi:hypothetical protein
LHPSVSAFHQNTGEVTADTHLGIILPPNEGVLRRSDQMDRVLFREAEIFPSPNVISFALHEFGVAEVAGRLGASENRL